MGNQTLVPHPEYPKRYYAGEGRLDIKLKNGETTTGYMEQPHGGPKYPLSMDEVVHIYRNYCSGVLEVDLIERTKDSILSLENEPDLKPLFNNGTFQANSKQQS